MGTKERADVRLEIYSDVICPWCYVGKARLDEALNSLNKNLNIDVAWKPFELNPTMPADGADRKEYMMRKFGTSAVTAMSERITAVGAEAGLQFNFARIERTPNTFNAHRLLWYAKSTGKQNELSEKLFQKYFTDALDIGNLDVLVAAAEEAGLPTNEVRQFLQSDDGKKEVKLEEQEGRLLGITAVPTFLVNGEVVASGALPASELAALIEQAAQPLASR